MSALFFEATEGAPGFVARLGVALVLVWLMWGPWMFRAGKVCAYHILIRHTQQVLARNVSDYRKRAEVYEKHVDCNFTCNQTKTVVIHRRNFDTSVAWTA